MIRLNRASFSQLSNDSDIFIQDCSFSNPFIFSEQRQRIFVDETRVHIDKFLKIFPNKPGYLCTCNKARSEIGILIPMVIDVRGNPICIQMILITFLDLISPSDDPNFPRLRSLRTGRMTGRKESRKLSVKAGTSDFAVKVSDRGCDFLYRLLVVDRGSRIKGVSAGPSGGCEEAERRKEGPK